ncbi:hypothetical protein Ga0080574_TMP4970 (plasmid) [Salipiger abyssi]|uniref:Uncharacterized protein n=1 Tax=Salipiger abyssi TaxID=1250539 RepID=A0A1P8V0S4_9RHOB|nr:hypothetical protein Ga0080574_TMP4970 [Salipiger abyssi]
MCHGRLRASVARRSGKRIPAPPAAPLPSCEMPLRKARAKRVTCGFHSVVFSDARRIAP